MALDPRYRWTVEQGVQGPDGHPKPLPIGIGIEDGRVVVDTHGRVSLSVDAADYLWASVAAAAAAARQQRGRL